jgi:hypothetical protein
MRLALRRGTKERLLVMASVLQEPLACLHSLLPVLIIKQLQANVLHISALTALLPTVAILSFYWGSFIHNRASLYIIRTNLVSAIALTAIPFLFAPCINNPWFFILAAGFYSLFQRAAIPARIEIFKQLFNPEVREQLYSRSFRASYATGMILGPCFGFAIDYDPSIWKLLFACSAVLYCLSALLYHKLPVRHVEQVQEKKSAHQLLVEPWQKSARILRQNNTFARFQIGFFIAGFGLMLAKPAGELLLGSLPISYYMLFICRTFIKGAGTILSAKPWSRLLKPQTVIPLASVVAYGFFAYTTLLMGASITPYMILPAYLLYGVVQSGSHLVWNLSGALLSGKESSCQYSSVNILTVGLRGCIAPWFGGACIGAIGLLPTLGIGAAIMIAGAVFLRHQRATSPSSLPL